MVRFQAITSTVFAAQEQPRSIGKRCILCGYWNCQDGAALRIVDSGRLSRRATNYPATGALSCATTYACHSVSARHSRQPMSPKNGSGYTILKAWRLSMRFGSDSMSHPDEDTLLRAVEVSRGILTDYVALGDPTLAVDPLLAVLDKDDVVRALDRLKRRRILHLVE